MKKILLASVGLLVLLLAVVLIRTLGGSDGRVAVEPLQAVAVDSDKIAGELSDAIRLRTVSPGALGFDPEFMIAFRDWLARTYPGVHRAATRTLVSDYTLLFELPGSDASLKPALLAAHFDVVPVVPGTESDWEQAPYSGLITDGFVWGRGALDDKGSLVTMMHALESLLADGYQPARTLYLAFGHDEEVGGGEGAFRVAELLASRGVELEWVLDEGGVVGEELLAGVERQIATVGIAEKGSVTLDITASAAGGHSSMPPRDTAIAVLADAIVQLNNSPVPGGVEGLSADFLDGVAPALPFTQRMAVRNRWLLGGVLESELSKNPAANAMLRTTTAPTLINGGVKENVLPSMATAVVNFRVHPRDTPDSIAEWVERRIGSERISVAKRNNGRPASGVSPIDGEPYALLERTIARSFPDAVVAPYLVVGGTDARHYDGLTDAVYRFIPIPMDAADRARFHGTNERVAVEDLVRAVGFYRDLLENL